MTLMLLLLFACPKQAPEAAMPDDPAPAQPTEVAPFEHGASAGVSDAELARLLDEHWAWTMRKSPVWASSLGDRSGDGKLGDGSPEAWERHREERDAFLQRARAIDTSALGPADALTHRVFVVTLEDQVAVDACGFEQWSLSPRNNPITTLGYLPEIRPLDGPEDLDLLAARYEAMGEAIAQDIANLRLGIASGRFANAESTQRVLQMVRDQLDTPTAEWASVTAVSWGEAGAPEGAEATLVATLDSHVRGPLGDYADLIENEILPSARTGADAGLTGLGEAGAACYAALVRSHTSLDKTPEEIHQVGLDELEKIHAEFAEIGGRALGTSDRAAIFERLRTDEALYFETAEQVEAKAVSALAAAKDKMPEYFGRLPQADCVVKRVPEHEAPYTTIAYYRQPAADGSRPGEYRVNVYAPETRPRHEAAVLAYHEAIPGHHLQIAISQELSEVPAFRRHDGTTAFVEGWALYTERLADEMGLYEDDIDRLGMLSFDAWRAARLVVDTGVHHKGWTREQAVLFMLTNTPLAPNNIDNEVDRYISWPGQALAYKLGQLEMWRLRRLSEDALRDDFDIRAFHDVVLGEGAVPLGVLETRVRDWIDGQVR